MSDYPVAQFRQTQSKQTPALLSGSTHWLMTMQDFLKLLIRSGNLSPMSLPAYQQQTYSRKPPPKKDEAERSEGTQQTAASVTDRTNATFLLFTLIFTSNYTFEDRCQWWWTVRLLLPALMMWDSLTRTISCFFNLNYKAQFGIFLYICCWVEKENFDGFVIMTKWCHYMMKTRH